MSADEVSSPVEPANIADSKKRKAELEEIEVDLTLPEPPSKKAKRMLKKGKTLPVKKDSDDEEDDEDVKQGLPPKSAGKNGKESKRSEYGIWVGNLPFTVTRVELFKWLVESSGGAITEESITRVNLPTSKIKAPGADKDAKPQNRGFAYVDFDKEASSIAAMALTETEISGRKVLIKSSKSFEGRPAKEAGATEGAASAAATPKNTIRKIYVGNLSFQTTEDDLRHQFDKCGEIEFIKVATFEDSGKCKGFGWVRFKEPEAAESAVKGFCKIKEEIETEDDFKDAEDKSENDDDEDEGADKETSKPERKYKTRKWWVNRLKGRELKIQYAEDDQVRYKKRFGKDRPQVSESGGQRGGDRDQSGPRARAPAKPAYGEVGVASYLTGSVVKPEGKKTTFD
ncbi:nucleolin [Microdochium nivale]|nr:nucleolin [Microdochium nivale]